MVELSGTHMEAVCGGTPNSQNLINNLNGRLSSVNVSIKMNISIVLVLHTVINAPVVITIT